MILGVAARHSSLRGLRGTRPERLQPLVTRHFYSSSAPITITTVPLSYDLHEPAKPVSDNTNRTSPILFLHGLFGSKKNNRSISKYAVPRTGGKELSGRGEEERERERERLNMFHFLL